LSKKIAALAAIFFLTLARRRGSSRPKITICWHFYGRRIRCIWMVNIRIYGYSDTLLVIFSMRVFSQNSGTYCMVPWHWGAFVVPISDLLHWRILHFFLFCLFFWLNKTWTVKPLRGAWASPKTVLLSAQENVAQARSLRNKMRRRQDFLIKKLCRKQNWWNKFRHRQDFLTES